MVVATDRRPLCLLLCAPPEVISAIGNFLGRCSWMLVSRSSSSHVTPEFNVKLYSGSGYWTYEFNPRLNINSSLPKVPVQHLPSQFVSSFKATVSFLVPFKIVSYQGCRSVEYQERPHWCIMSDLPEPQFSSVHKT